MVYKQAEPRMELPMLETSGEPAHSPETACIVKAAQRSETAIVSDLRICRIFYRKHTKSSVCACKILDVGHSQG